MAVPQSMQRQGFRKWYERQLLTGHSHLVLVVLCAVAVAGAMEAFFSQPDGSPLVMVASVGVASALGVWALRCYLFLLMRTELIANQAVCAACKTYGRWAIESQSAADEQTGPGRRLRAVRRPPLPPPRSPRCALRSEPAALGAVAHGKAWATGTAMDHAGAFELALLHLAPDAIDSAALPAAEIGPL